MNDHLGFGLLSVGLCGSSVQVERKRHIGNDIVNIVFIDEGDLSEFGPSCIKSQFTRILLPNNLRIN